MERTYHLIQNLLIHTSIIQKKYDEIAELTGENFNIFRILKLDTREVRTHSAFLAELLNPKGTHGQKDTFLKLFIEEIKAGKKDLSYFKTDNAVAKVEHYIGPKTETHGGRIDILIKSGKHNIIIENKIYALDQECQLVRYHNHDTNAPIYYLTLGGHQRPSDTSKGHLKKDENYWCISYESEILKWLEKCREKAATHALLRETLTQYIYLIKHLTNKALNKKMEKELIDLILKSSENMKAYEYVHSADVRSVIIHNKIGPQLVELAEKFDLGFEEGGKEEGAKLFYLRADFLAENNICIGFGFAETYYEFGFAKADFKTSITDHFKSYLQQEIEKLPPNAKVGDATDNWPAYKGNTIDYEMLSAIWNDKLFEYLRDTMIGLISIAKGYIKPELKEE